MATEAGLVSVQAVFGKPAGSIAGPRKMRRGRRKPIFADTLFSRSTWLAFR